MSKSPVSQLAHVVDLDFERNLLVGGALVEGLIEHLHGTCIQLDVVEEVEQDEPSGGQTVGV